MGTFNSGDEVAGCRIESVLGRGGFATVYAATDAQSGPVALKIIDLERDDEAQRLARARFQREVAALQKLRSPFTVKLYRHGDLGDALFMVFERLAGVDLREVLEQGRTRDPALTLRILKCVLESLAEAHQHGLLHRDIKPENIRVLDQQSAEPMIKVLDFGIARSTDASLPTVTATGEVMGTPRYMSPEQLRGRKLTPASDVYSAGMVGFELLMGEDALAGYRVTEQLDRLHSDHLLAMPDLEGTDVEVMRLIQRMTATEPGDRPATAAAALRQLEAIEGGETRTLPAVRASQTFDAPQDRRGLYAIVVLAALIVVATIVVVIGRADEPPPSSTSPVVTAPIVEAPVQSTPAIAVANSPDLGPDAHEIGAGDASVGCKPELRGRGTLLGNPAYVPAEGDAQRYPLVILLTHTHNLPAAFLDSSGFIPIAEREKFVVVASERGVGGWRDPDRYAENIRLDAESFRDAACVDPARVFAVSHFKGARAAMALSCEPWITAVAAHSFLPSLDNPMWCEHQVPTIWLNPIDSALVTADGSKGCGKTPSLTLDEFEQMWRARNRCGGPSTQTFKDGRSTCVSWSCAQPFESCRLDGGFVWKGVTPGIFDKVRCKSEQAPDVDIAERMWAFLKKAPPLPQPQ